MLAVALIRQSVSLHVVLDANRIFDRHHTVCLLVQGASGGVEFSAIFKSSGSRVADIQGLCALSSGDVYSQLICLRCSVSLAQGCTFDA